MSIEYKKINDIDDIILSKIVDLYDTRINERIVFSDETFLFAAMDGDIPVGYVYITPQVLAYPLEHLKDAYIEIVEVHENYQRQGIGQHLILCAEEWAKKAGFKQIRTHSNNKSVEAINMWYKLNYGLCQHVYYAEEGCAGYWVAKVL
jgi:GNAT superfamily N-acetyltransferase